MKKEIPILQSMEKTKDTRYLKAYTLNYLNTEGKKKIYDIVSYNDLKLPEEIGSRASGVVIIGYKEDQLLLLKEFRMGVNDFVYNFPAGHIDKDESVKECTKRELYEETGLSITEIIDVLPPSYAAPDMSDSAAWVVIARVEGELSDHTDANEWIKAGFYGKNEVKKLLSDHKFSGRAQLAAWFFVHGTL